MKKDTMISNIKSLKAYTNTKESIDRIRQNTTYSEIVENLYQFTIISDQSSFNAQSDMLNNNKEVKLFPKKEYCRDS